MADITKASLKRQLDKLEAKMVIAQNELLVAQEAVQKLDREIRAMKSALTIMEGPAPAGVFSSPLPRSTQTADKIEPAAPGKLPDGYVMVNGEPMLLEPGMKIVKNGLGEDCMVPVDTPEDALLKTEPEKPIIFPSLAPADTTPSNHPDFVDPRELA